MDLVSESSREMRLTFLKWEGFVVVEEESGSWALYFDKDDDGLTNKVQGKRITEVELCREATTDLRPGGHNESDNGDDDDQPD